MKHYVGLNVSMKEASICVVDETRKVVKERKVGSEPERSAYKGDASGTSIEDSSLATAEISVLRRRGAKHAEIPPEMGQSGCLAQPPRR